MKTACIVILGIFGITASVELRGQDNSERWAEFTKSVFPILKRGVVAEQRLAVQKFSSEDYPEAARYLCEMIVSRRVPPALKLEASKILEGYQNPGALAAIETAVKASGGGNKFLLAPFIKQGKPESRAFLLDLVKKAKTPGIQALAIDGISLLPPGDAISPHYTNALIKWIEDEDTFHGIRLAATRALGRIPQKEVVPVLIEYLYDPLLMNEARDALLRLTGEKHWMDQTAWEEWWKTAQLAFAPKSLDEKVFQAERKKLLDELGDNNTLNAEFYGRKLEGKNILFLLDNSGSMIQDDRIGRLKEELNAMIEHLTEKYQFGFVIFPRQNVPGRDFDKATDRYRERALKFVEQMQPNGGTPMIQAIEYAFKRVVSRQNVDTIYLLSDGQPSDLGKEDLTNILLRWNEIYDVSINTIFIGDDIRARGLMEQVAKDSGGSFFAVP